MMLAQIEYREGNHNEARELVNKALSLEPDPAKKARI
jgi:hypothetical protein